eukprot:10409083-Alexandrium_andersonii.AAC.1
MGDCSTPWRVSDRSPAQFGVGARPKSSCSTLRMVVHLGEADFHQLMTSASSARYILRGNARKALGSVGAVSIAL